MNAFKHNSEENYIEIIQRLVKAIVVLLAIIVILLVFIVWGGRVKATDADPTLLTYVEQSIIYQFR